MIEVNNMEALKTIEFVSGNIMIVASRVTIRNVRGLRYPRELMQIFELGFPKIDINPKDI
jgi:hypothetical protein